MRFYKSGLYVAVVAISMSGISLSTSVQAQSSNPHVHGSAAMNIILQEQQLFAEFEAPMASLLGFEYQPQSRIEKLKLKNAVKALKQSELFQFEGASCELVSAESELPWASQALHDKSLHEKGHDEKEHHSHVHDEKEHHGHAHDENENHAYDINEHLEHKHIDHHGDTDSHSDIRLTYQFSCDGEVKGVLLNHFTSFSLMESIKVQWITGAGQGATSVSKTKTSFSF